MEYKPELKQEAEEKQFTHHIPHHIQKQVNRYNNWVKERRLSKERHKPKPKRIGRKTPFHNENPFYISRDLENEQKKYPILKEMKELGDSLGEKQDAYTFGYNYGLEKHYGVK